MDAFIYQADIYCDGCARRIMAGMEQSEDSEAYPQGPYCDGGGEADSPQHCGECRTFLENPLTRDGYAYVIETAHDRGANDVISEWLEFYDIDLKA